MNKWRGLLLTQSPKEMDHQPWAWFTPNQKPEKSHLLDGHRHSRVHHSFPPARSRLVCAESKQGWGNAPHAAAKPAGGALMCSFAGLRPTQLNWKHKSCNQPSQLEMNFFLFPVLVGLSPKALKDEHAELVPFVRANWEREKCSSPTLD